MTTDRRPVTEWSGPPLDAARPLSNCGGPAHPEWSVGQRLRLRERHASVWADPLRARAGETLRADGQRRTCIAGWLWCRDEAGRAGWAPRAWLTESDGTGWRLLRDYDAAELELPAGSEVRLEVVESGFAFVSLERPDANGRLAGWLPLEILAPVDGRAR